MKCRNCGRDIKKVNGLWHDDSLVFPQYCSSHDGIAGELHKPLFSVLEYAKQYQNPELCEKYHNNIPLSELNGDGLILSTDDRDIQGIREYFSFVDTSELTGVVYKVGDGDFEEMYVTESSRPYDLQAVYHPLSYYVEE